MCAIADYANVGNAAVASDGTEAAKGFLRYVSDGGLKLLLGGSKMNDEILGCSQAFRRWLSRALETGCVLRASDDQVDEVAKRLTDADCCESDDEHLVALARVTGARLIFTNDRALQRDCKALLSPPASVYTTNDERTSFSPQKRRLLTTTTCNNKTRSSSVPTHR